MNRSKIGLVLTTACLAIVGIVAAKSRASVQGFITSSAGKCTVAHTGSYTKTVNSGHTAKFNNKALHTAIRTAGLCTSKLLYTRAE